MYSEEGTDYSKYTDFDKYYINSDKYSNYEETGIPRESHLIYDCEML